MSTRRRRHAARRGVRGCVGKRRYGLKREAREAITRLRLYQPHAGDARLNVYWCTTCEAWHVGHRPRRMTHDE